MIKTRKMLNGTALRRAVIASFALPLFAGVGALAQDTPLAGAPAAEAEKLERTVVTGSLIPTAETVQVAPIETISRQAIRRTGDQDVLAVLKKLTSSFSGNGNTGQEVNNGGAGEAYVALRNLPSLVLLDGRRMANSAFSNGAAVDLNTIPLAMIERVEVLMDGASVTYGSDAIGGVINIITKKNYNGLEVGGRFGFTTESNKVWEHRVSLIAGTENEKASFVAGMAEYHMDPIYSTNRYNASASAESLYEKNLWTQNYHSPSYPGYVRQSGQGAFLLAGSPFLKGSPYYNPAVQYAPAPGTAPIPGIPYVPGVYNSVNAYRAAHPGVYIPIEEAPQAQFLADTGQGGGNFWPMLNTTTLGTYSQQSQDRRNAWYNFNYDLFGKKMQLYSNFLFADNASQGKLAPSPVGSFTGSQMYVPADSPINPFGIALGYGAPTADPFNVKYRFADTGARIFNYTTKFYNFVTGLKGNFEGDHAIGYDLGFNYSKSDQMASTQGAINGAALDAAMRPNANPALAAQGFSALTYAGQTVPLYNPFSNGGLYGAGANDPATAAAITTTLFNPGLSTLIGTDGKIYGNLVELPAGQLGFAVGASWMSETLETDYDGLTKMGKVPGLNPALPTYGTKVSSSAYFELMVPILSPSMDIPGVYSLEGSVAARYTYVNPGGGDTVPKVGLRYAPIKEVTLRGTYSQGFLTPSVYQLYGGDGDSYPAFTVGGVNAQRRVTLVSNPNLTPATSENWSAGFVYSPDQIKNLTISADYYWVKVENQVYRVSASAMSADLNAYGSDSAYAPAFYFADGTQLTTPDPGQLTDPGNWGVLRTPLANGATQQTDGIDVAINYAVPTDNYGTFSAYVNANVIFNYTYQDPEIGGPYAYENQFTGDGVAGGANGTLPRFQLATGMNWDYKNLSYTVVARFVPEVKDYGDMHPSSGSDINNYTVDGSVWTIPSYYTIDMQLAYEFGKNKTVDRTWYDGFRVAVGCNNITDQQPRLISSSFEDITDKSTYGILGRFFYTEFSMKF